jgi:hypothetical protein
MHEEIPVMSVSVISLLGERPILDITDNLDLLCGFSLLCLIQTLKVL